MSEGGARIKETFDETYKRLSPPPDSIVAGTLSLLTGIDRTESSAHALFFQCDEQNRQFRFYDYSSRFRGFYNFSNASALFDALVVHVKTWDQFADGQLIFLLHAIPKPGYQQV